MYIPAKFGNILIKKKKITKSFPKQQARTIK